MVGANPENTIPLLEETLHVGKRTVETDRVRISTSTEERRVHLEDTVQRGDLQIERVTVDRAVAQAPEPRQEGDTLIISVVEERLVTEKRLFVIEEVRVTHIVTERPIEILDTVRVMHATVDQVSSGDQNQHGEI